MAGADEMFRAQGFARPSFAYWTADEFRARRDVARNVIDARCGWDITIAVPRSTTILSCSS